MATTSLVSAVAGAALLVPIAPADAASCAISVTGNSGAVSNSAAINCIGINGGNVSGNVTNAQTGTITAGNQAGTQTGIFINNSTVTGSVVNNGSISALNNGGGINVIGSSGVADGLTNTGSISGNLFGAQIKNVPTFAGGITNSGTLSNKGATTAAINISGVTVFSGGVINTGQIAATHNIAIAAFHVSTFTGGISNIGLIHAASDGIFIAAITNFSGGISNAGTIVAGTAGIAIGNQVSTFTGGINNSGTITAQFDGIGILDVATFQSGISNGGIITVTSRTGILIRGGTTFSGGVTNTGKISAVSNGIFLNGVTNFSGGVTNTGSISASLQQTGGGIALLNVSTFAGGITNSGTISINSVNGVNGEGISVNGPSSFSNGVTNTGIISVSGGTGIGIYTVNFKSFSGGILNEGTISLIDNQGTGIGVVRGTVFSGGITNSGTISIVAPVGAGISVFNVATFLGGISNGGVITVSGASGIAVLGTGTSSTFAGGITNSGTISAVNNGIKVDRISNFSGGFTNAGTIAASISGNNSTGAGLTLSRISTFAGGVTNSGLISVNVAHGFTGEGIVLGTLGTFSNGLTNTGTISVSGPGSGLGIVVQPFTSFSGGISNQGLIALNVAGQGSGIVVGAGSVFTGGITNSGTISVAGSPDDFGIAVANVSTFSGIIANTGSITAAVGIGVINSGAVSLFDTGSIIGTSGTAIDLSHNAAGNTLTLGPGYAITGKVLGQGADTFQLGGTGSGSFDLSTVGPTQQYQGFTTFNVVSGIWTVSNTFSPTLPWNVNGGTLAGTGTLYSVNVNNGGTLEPGTPGTPGTAMTLTNNLAFQPNAIYLVQLNTTTNSIANVAGTAALNGMVDGAGLPSKKNYDILHTGGLNGTFTGFFDPNFTGTLTYTATDVFLNVTGANLGGGSGLNQNQQNVANTLNNYFNATGSVPPGFTTVFGLSGTSLANALTQLSGEAATGTQQAATQLTTEFLDMMLDPFVAGRGGNGGGGGGGASGFAAEQPAGFPPDIALAYNSVMHPPQPAAFEQRWTVWGSGFGGSSTTNGNATVGSNNLTAGTYGVAAGMDYHFTPDTIAGIALAGAGTSWSLAQNLGSGRSDAFQAGLYGKTNYGPAYLAAAVSFANHWFSTSRISFAGDQLGAKFEGQSYGGRFEAGYRYQVTPATGVAPYAAVQVQSFHTPGYSETDFTGGGFGLSYNAMNATDTRSELGARVDSLQVFNAMPVVWHARAAWAHDWVSNPALGAAFESLPGTSFIVNGATPPANSALASAGAKLYLTPAWSLDAKFDGEFASGSQTYAGTGTLRYAW